MLCCCMPTDDQFISAVSESFSVRQTLEKLGLVPQGGNYQTFRKKALALNLDISHFKRPSEFRKYFPRRPVEDYLNNSAPIDSSQLKARLLKEGYLWNHCYLCFHPPQWQGQPLTLQLDHIDGDSYNNNLSNLRILCPHCHTQTSTYAGKKNQKRSIAPLCLDCGCSDVRSTSTPSVAEAALLFLGIRLV